LSFIKASIFFKQKYNITLPIDILGCGNVFTLDRIKVGDIKRSWEGKIYRLNEVSPYKYLETKDKSIYENYVKNNDGIRDTLLKRFAIELNKEVDKVKTYESMDNTLNSIKEFGYDPSKMCICVDADNIILDGQHRACCLLYLHGEDYIIDVCRVLRDES